MINLLALVITVYLIGAVTSLVAWFIVTIMNDFKSQKTMLKYLLYAFIWPIAIFILAVERFNSLPEE